MCVCTDLQITEIPWITLFLTFIRRAGAVHRSVQLELSLEAAGFEASFFPRPLKHMKKWKQKMGFRPCFCCQLEDRLDKNIC